jgi:hypothetical protein
MRRRQAEGDVRTFLFATNFVVHLIPLHVYIKIDFKIFCKNQNNLSKNVLKKRSNIANMIK